MNKTLNHEVAEKLLEIANLLKQQDANPFRVRAYRNAVHTVDTLKENIQDIVERKNINGLVELPTIGTGIAYSIYEYVATGRMSRLENLRGESDPVSLFQKIPVVGPKLAKRIYENLHVDSLESLNMAAQDGRLENVPSIGQNRVKAIQAWLETTLGRYRGKVVEGKQEFDIPSVEVLLEIDERYRKKAELGELPTVTPKRNNPGKKYELSVLHISQMRWHFTALYSNTALAHKLDRTKDWVVIYFYDHHHQEGQHTVVTETRGALVGKRVVRGREKECRAFYATPPIIKQQYRYKYEYST